MGKDYNLGPSRFYKQILGIAIGPKKWGPKAVGKPLKKDKPIVKAGKVKKLFTVYASQGSGERQSREEWFKRDLEGITDEELKKLNQKIQLLSEHVFEEVEDSDRFDQMTQETSEFITTKMRISRKQKQNLRRKIYRRTDQLLKDGVDDLTNDEIKREFSEVIEQYRNGIRDGLIVPRKNEKRALTFVKNAILNYLAR